MLPGGAESDEYRTSPSAVMLKLNNYYIIFVFDKYCK
jgi:hypothetical protein